jgi:hypothetical protein
MGHSPGILHNKVAIQAGIHQVNEQERIALPRPIPRGHQQRRSCRGQRRSDATCPHARKSLQLSRPNARQQQISHGADDEDDDGTDERDDHKHEGERTSSKHKEQRGTRTRWRLGWRTGQTTEEGVPPLQEDGFPQTQQLHQIGKEQGQKVERLEVGQ